MKLADRLTLAFSTTVAAVVLVSFSLVHVLVQRDEERDLDRVLRVQAARLAARVAGGARDLDTLAELPESPHLTVLRAALYDGSGALLAATASFGGAAPQVRALRLPPALPDEGAVVEIGLGQERLRGVVLPVDARGARLLYAVSRQSIDADLAYLVRIFAALFLAALVVTHLVARRLAAHLGRDVAALMEVAESVAAGDLAARVGVRARGSRETRALGVALDRMIARLDALVSAQATFLSHAAHELRSPLATLRGELQLALRRPRTDEEYKEALHEALGDVEQLTALAEDLLTLARIQGRGPRVPARVNVGDLVADAVRMARGGAEARGIQVAVDVADAAPAVSGSRLDLVRAVRNLLDNAIVHAPQGGSVRIAVRPAGDEVTVAIENLGRPVPDGDADHVFAPFFRGEEAQASDAPGAGLGLAIARGIARAHGGEVALDRSFTAGARFVLTLPIAADGAIEKAST